MKRATLSTLMMFTLISPAWAQSGPAVHARFDFASVSGAPFPSDLYTIPEPRNRTGRRVNMPLPVCSTRRSDCNDLAVVNTMDGFNLMPRISVPFDGDIDVRSVSSASVFVVELAQDGEATVVARHVAINQVVWDPATLTLHVESDEVLRQSARHALIVTNGIHDAWGRPVQASKAFDDFRHDLNYGQTNKKELEQAERDELKQYRKALITALEALERSGKSERDVVVLSVFTTQSATATLENIRDYLKSSPPPLPASFAIPGESRAVFSAASIKDITHRQHRGNTFSNATVPLASLRFVPGAVGAVGWGTFASPQFIDASAVMTARGDEPIGTLSELPKMFGESTVQFVVFLPAGPRPASGWPVVFLGHGGTTSIHTDAVWNFASTLAAKGLASIAINAVGRGWGPNSSLRIELTNGTVVQFSAPGRAIDQDGDGVILNAEGAVAAAPNIIVGQRDAVRQTAVDYMQLVRVIQSGVDVDGDGAADLDPARLMFFGNSFAVGYELLFMALEPDVRVGAVGSPGALAGRSDLLSMRPSGRTAVGAELKARVPSLLNEADGLTSLGGLRVDAPLYNENVPLRDLAAVINTIPGAMAIQEYFERIEWVQNSSDAAAYAAHLQSEPLSGVPAKSMMVMFAKGDQTAPNPRTSYIVRAGSLQDRTIFYRNDSAFAEDPTVPKDPHIFLQRFANAGIAGEVARDGQETVALFLASGGTAITLPVPMPSRRFYDFPIRLLPEDYSYIP